MRRGRVFIYLALIIVVVVVGAFLYLRTRKPAQVTGSGATPTATMYQALSAQQDIPSGVRITDAMLGAVPVSQADMFANGYTIDKAQVVGLYAKTAIPAGSPIKVTDLTATSGNVNLAGSDWARNIPSGFTAVSIPVSRLSSVAYGLWDGDYVDVIVTMLLIDIDPSTQTGLPNLIAGIKIEGGGVTITPANIAQGKFVVDDTSGAVSYVYPGENQRPRQVTQMILQKIQVLHIGTFTLKTQAAVDQANAQPTAAGNGQNQAVPVVVKPDVITLMVSPQDAVTLTYLIYSGAQINLTLRNPDDQDEAAQPDAVMLEYLLTQYNIPVPEKLPFSINPPLDTLKQPTLGNDIIP
jgi:Flp pilus assembly protein CpaB